MLFPMSPAVNRSLALLLALGLAGCAWMRAGKGVKSCRYRFHGLAFTGLSGAQTNWRVDLSVVNPNSHPVTLNRMRYALLHGADTLLAGWNPAARELAPGDSQPLEATLELPHAAWKRLPPGIFSDTAAKFTLIGDAYLDTWVGPLRFPGALRQEIKVNMPEQIVRYRDLMLQRFFQWPTRPPEKPEGDSSPPPAPRDDTL
jgi:hypothetical protein